MRSITIPDSQRGPVRTPGNTGAASSPLVDAHSHLIHSERRTALATNALFLLLFLGLLWGSSYSLIMYVSASIPPITLNAVRVSLAALVLAAYARAQGHSFPSDGATWRWFVAQGTINPGIAWVLLTWAQQYIGGGVTAIINTMSPLFAVVITLLITRDERFTATKLGGIVIGFLGVVVLMLPSVKAGSGEQLLAIGAAVLGTIGFAAAATIGRQLSRLAPSVLAAGALSGASFVLVPASLIIDKPWTLTPDFSTIAVLLFLTLVSTAFAFVIYFRLLKTIGSAGTLSVGYVRVAVAVVLGAIFYAEPITLAVVLGLACVVVGVIAVTRKPVLAG